MKHHLGEQEVVSTMNNSPTEVLQTTWKRPMLLRIRANRIFLEVIFDLCGVIEAGMVFTVFG